ncbi:hypothetical protein ElyMa_003357400 [Elysia marginata]|uniref:Uncharacterized protein n=1 Tax=Elysia marginata TaxID=1093978 RepID=A0AAV4JKC3_9GAST|nr:hypothetical protein ElyMa_003357400 [Elysia marginata]
MAVSKTVLAILCGMLAGMGQVSCSLYTDHKPTTAHGSRLPANSVIPNTEADDDGTDSMGKDVFRELAQDETMPEEEEEGGEDESAENDLPKYLTQLRKVRQDRSGMTKIVRSYNLPYSSPSSLTSSSSFPSSSLSASKFSRRVPSSRTRASQRAHLVESRRRARARQSELRAQNFRRTILNGLGLERAPSTSIDSETRQALLNWLLDRQQAGNSRLAERAHVQRNCYLGQCECRALQSS